MGAGLVFQRNTISPIVTPTHLSIPLRADQMAQGWCQLPRLRDSWNMECERRWIRPRRQGFLTTNGTNEHES